MNVFEEPKGNTHVCVVSAVRIKGECTIERVALVMNLIPCRELVLMGLDKNTFSRLIIGCFYVMNANV